VKTLMIPAAAIAMAMGAAPLMAQNYDNGRYDRAYADRQEVRDSRDRVERERYELRDARRYGSHQDVKAEQRDYDRAQKEFRKDSRDWQRGRNYGYGRPDPRYNGYYADNYYRSGANYRARPLGVNDRIYRGQDNRYYCRRSDGTTGLIIGAIGGGVLGNVIAPGGSKTLGSILGGGLGAVLGSSIDRGNVTCR
jgi:hypothetical protein